MASCYSCDICNTRVLDPSQLSFLAWWSRDRVVLNDVHHLKVVLDDEGDDQKKLIKAVSASEEDLAWSPLERVNLVFSLQYKTL